MSGNGATMTEAVCGGRMDEVSLAAERDPSAFWEVAAAGIDWDERHDHDHDSGNDQLK